jgi:hypothetical protein
MAVWDVLAGHLNVWRPLLHAMPVGVFRSLVWFSKVLHVHDTQYHTPEEYYTVYSVYSVLDAVIICITNKAFIYSICHSVHVAQPCMHMQVLGDAAQQVACLAYHMQCMLSATVSIAVWAGRIDAMGRQD